MRFWYMYLTAFASRRRPDEPVLQSLRRLYTHFMEVETGPDQKLSNQHACLICDSDKIRTKVSWTGLFNISHIIIRLLTIEVHVTNTSLRKFPIRQPVKCRSTCKCIDNVTFSSNDSFTHILTSTYKIILKPSSNGHLTCYASLESKNGAYLIHA